MSSTGKRKFNSNYCFHALDLYFNEIRHQTYFTSLREMRVYVDISSITWSSSAARKHISDGHMQSDHVSKLPHNTSLWYCQLWYLWLFSCSVMRVATWPNFIFLKSFLITHMHKYVLFRLIPTAECTCIILSKYAKNEMLILLRKSWRYVLAEPSLFLPIDTREFSHDVSVRPHASKSVQTLVRGREILSKGGEGRPRHVPYSSMKIKV